MEFIGRPLAQPGQAVNHSPRARRRMPRRAPQPVCLSASPAWLPVHCCCSTPCTSHHQCWLSSAWWLPEHFLNAYVHICLSYGSIWHEPLISCQLIFALLTLKYRICLAVQKMKIHECPIQTTAPCRATVAFSCIFRLLAGSRQQVGKLKAKAAFPDLRNASFSQ